MTAAAVLGAALLAACFQASGLADFDIRSEAAGGQAPAPGTGGAGGGAGGECPTDEPALACGQAAPIETGTCPQSCDSCETTDAGYTCIITCDDNVKCNDKSTVCPPGLPCRVECVSDSSCEQGEIHCPPEHPCEVLCDSPVEPADACASAAVYCGEAPCSIDCAPGQEQCDNAEVHCGVNECRAVCRGESQPTLLPNCASECDYAPCE